MRYIMSHPYLVGALLDIVTSQKGIGAAVDEKCCGGAYTPYCTGHHEADAE